MPWWIFENTLIAAILALIVVLASRTARLAPVIRHGLWFVVFIKLITPPIFSVDLPVRNPWRESALVDRHAGRSRQFIGNAQAQYDGRELAGTDRALERPSSDQLSTALDASPLTDSAGEQDGAGFAESATVTDRVDSTFGVPNQQIAAGDPPDTSPPAGESARATTPYNQFAVEIAIWCFVAGTCLMATLQSLRLFRLRRLLGRSVAAPGDFIDLVTDLAIRMRQHPPAVRLSYDVNSPIVCAVGRAVLIWPASGLTTLHGPARQGVIVHELAHLARRDHWIGWLELTVSCAWWWNPVFWYVRRQLHDNAELACDAWAAALFPEGKRDYARALVDLAERDLLQTAAGPALGVGDGSRKLFERRLVMILGEGVRYRMGILGMIGTGLLGLLALPGCSASLAGDESASSEPAVDFLSKVADPPAEATRLPVLAEPAIGQQPAALGPLPIALDQARPAAEPARPTNDERLKRLEDKFEALISELQALHSSPARVPINPPKDLSRGGNATPQAAGTPADAQKFTATIPATSNQPGAKQPRTATPAASFPPFTTVTEGPDGTTVESQWPIPHKHHIPNPAAIAARSADGESVSLTRAKYKLPAGKADEVAEFLKANLSDDVEVRVKDGALQVTATTGDQAAIAQFVRLLQTHNFAKSQSNPKANLFRRDAKPATPQQSIERNNDFNRRSSDSNAETVPDERSLPSEQPRQEKPDANPDGVRLPESTRAPTAR